MDLSRTMEMLAVAIQKEKKKKTHRIHRKWYISSYVCESKQNQTLQPEFIELLNSEQVPKFVFCFIFFSVFFIKSKYVNLKDVHVYE